MLGNASEFICLNVTPGIGCNFYEMLFLGLLYLLTGLFCIVYFIIFLYKYVLSNKGTIYRHVIEEPLTKASLGNISSTNLINSNEILDTNNQNENFSQPNPNINYSVSRKFQFFFLIFWFSMFIWLTFDGVITIIPFEYNEFTYQFIFLDLDNILFLIPVSFFVLLVLEICFAWRNPGARIIILFRVVLGVFFFFFLLIGFLLSIFCWKYEKNLYNNPSGCLSLWICATDFIISLFFLFPSHQLIKLVSSPIIQPEDICCVRTSKIGTIVLFSFFIIKSCFNLFRFIGIDFAIFFNTSPSKKIVQNPLYRAYRFFQFFLFSLVPAWLVIAGALILSHYDFKFFDESQYTRTQNSLPNN